MIPNNQKITPPPEIRHKFDINQIKTTINLIKNTIDKSIKEGETDSFKHELQILELYPEFYDNYPFLVKKICKNDDMNMLYKMFENLQEIENGDTTINNVELKLGNELASQYLYPNIK